MAGHEPTSQEGETDIWLTPRHVLAALGEFDLDPCAAPDPEKWPTAREHIVLPRNGLAARWYGRVWLNPPYGRSTGAWMQRMAEHGYGTALIFARTETDVWQDYVWPYATAILFLRNRLTFHMPDGTPGDGNAGAPSALIAYGEADATRLAQSRLRGGYCFNFSTQPPIRAFQRGLEL